MIILLYFCASVGTYTVSVPRRLWLRLWYSHHPRTVYSGINGLLFVLHPITAASPLMEGTETYTAYL